VGLSGGGGQSKALDQHCLARKVLVRMLGIGTMVLSPSLVTTGAPRQPLCMA
jgi:hypothetical protein